MKKIVMGIAAVAMAASMFAADVSANLRFDASLFDYSDYDAKVVTKPEVTSHWYKAPTFALSVNGDRAGASFYMTSDGTIADHALLWFKPFDILKVEVGAADGLAVNTETIDYTNVISGSGQYAAILNTNGFTLGVNADASNGIISKKDTDDKMSVGKLYFKAGYSADFGAITAAVEGANTFKDIRCGAGYKGSVSDVTFFADVFYTATDTNAAWKASWEDEKVIGKPVTVDGFVTTSIDNLGINVYAKGDIPTVDGVDASVLAKAKLTLGLSNGLTASLLLQDNNILADYFEMTIKPGIAGNVGGMAWDVALDITAKKDIAISVPFSLSMAW